MRSVFLSGLCILFINGTYQSNVPKKIGINGIAQGTTYHITYYAEDSVVRKAEVDSVLDKIDSSLSLYKPYSLINRFNGDATGIIPDIHFKRVVNRAMQIFQQTNGHFDITVEPLTSAWGFGPNKFTARPDSAAIRKLLPCVGTRFLYWDKGMLKKKVSCVKLDANGIAQGYSVDVLADFFESRRIKNYVIELGGEIRIKGRKYPGRKKMNVGIEAPGDDPDFPLIEKVIWVREGAVTTSGNYRRYYESDGKRITHLINPQTGYPIRNDLISVTVFAKDAITADGYDNALMGMGLKNALAFVEKRKDIAAHFIFHKSDGTIADTMSKRFRVLLKP